MYLTSTEIYIHGICFSLYLHKIIHSEFAMEWYIYPVRFSFGIQNKTVFNESKLSRKKPKFIRSWSSYCKLERPLKLHMYYICIYMKSRNSKFLTCMYQKLAYLWWLLHKGSNLSLNLSYTAGRTSDNRCPWPTGWPGWMDGCDTSPQGSGLKHL